MPSHREVPAPSPPRSRVAGGPLRVVWDPAFRQYDFGPHHPFDERSRELGVDLLEATLAPEERRAVDWVRSVEPADRALVERFHLPRYVEEILAASASSARRPLDAGDTPSFPGCWDASRRLVGATAGAFRAALEDGRSSFVPGGGLHHARPERASGFCILNDLAVGIVQAVAAGRRLAYVDLDAHHGDGVMYGFYASGHVLDIDFHQDGRTLFPGTGAVRETGVGDGAGLKVNVPLPPGAGDEALVPLARRLVRPLLEEFAPELLVVQHGVDGHWGDPLARLQYTPAGYAEVDRLLLDFAQERRIPAVVTGGGGYRPASVARVLARAGRRFAGLALPPDATLLPGGWTSRFGEMFGGPGPTRWADPPHLTPSPWGRDEELRLVRALETALGRRFPPVG